MKKFYLAAMGLLVMLAVSAQNVETADLHQPVNVNDAVVTGGVLRTQVLRDSLIMNSETGQMEKTPVVVDYLDVPVNELGSKPEEAIEAAKVARRAAMRRASASSHAPSLLALMRPYIGRFFLSRRNIGATNKL